MSPPFVWRCCRVLPCVVVLTPSLRSLSPLCFSLQATGMLNPFPGPRSVLIIDNGSLNHVDVVKDVVTAHGSRIEYLAPYSPDFNPVREPQRVRPRVCFRVARGLLGWAGLSPSSYRA